MRRRPVGVFLTILVVLAMMLVPGSVAADDNSGGNPMPPGQYSTPDDLNSFVFSVNFNSPSDVFTYNVTTDGGVVGIRVADCCMAGDAFGADIVKPGKSNVKTVTNVVEGVPLGPDVFGNKASVGGGEAVVKVYALNTIPGGLPAGMYVQVYTDGTWVNFTPAP